MGRHWHAVNVRVDGLAPVLGRLLDDTRIRSAALVDVDSGMVLDACGGKDTAVDPTGAPPADLEVLSAGHADLVRVTLAVLHGPGRRPGRCEVVADDGAGHHHVLRVLPDAHGGPLALSVVVAGPERVVSRVRRRLRRVSSAALTAGPSAARRPPAVRRRPSEPVPPEPSPRQPVPRVAAFDQSMFGDPGCRTVRPAAPPTPRAAPPSALPPSRR